MDEATQKEEIGKTIIDLLSLENDFISMRTIEAKIALIKMTFKFYHQDISSARRSTRCVN